MFSHVTRWIIVEMNMDFPNTIMIQTDILTRKDSCLNEHIDIVLLHQGFKIHGCFFRQQVKLLG